MTDKYQSQIHVIVDLDGTICDNTERSKDLDETSKSSWDTFFSRALQDKPIEPIVKWVKLLSDICIIDIITGRPETIRNITVKWLKNNGIRFDTLWMRDPADTRYSPEYKQAKLDLIKELFPDGNFQLAFEDDPECIELYKKAGLTVIDPKPFTTSRDVGTNLSRIRDQ